MLSARGPPFGCVRHPTSQDTAWYSKARVPPSATEYPVRRFGRHPLTLRKHIKPTQLPCPMRRPKCGSEHHGFRPPRPCPNTTRRSTAGGSSRSAPFSGDGHYGNWATTASMTERVEAIHVAPAEGADPESVERVEAVVGGGLRDDRYFDGGTFADRDGDVRPDARGCCRDRSDRRVAGRGRRTRHRSLRCRPRSPYRTRDLSGEFATVRSTGEAVALGTTTARGQTR